MSPVSDPPAAICAACGSAVLTDAVAGQCPRCLLRMALQPEETVSEFGFDPGERQFGGYILNRQVGAGGMGVVYEGRRLGDNLKVAIKLIREFHVASPNLLCRFTIEAEAAARLDHPHIVRIHEVGEANGHPFFSMDFIEGESLSAALAAGRVGLISPAASSGKAGSVAQQRVARLMAKVARAVDHAHGRGVLHRDLKPGNILLDQQGEPHLTDFGLAKILQPEMDEAGRALSPPNGPRTLTTSGDAPGTPSYMAPEQVSGGEVGRAADVYGLGAVLYALLTGRPPFHGATPLEVFKQIAEQSPARPRSINPAIHPDLETICLKGLEKDPRHRYATAQALAGDLEQFSKGGPIQARPAAFARRVQQWVKRNPVGTALILSLSLGLTISLGLLKIVTEQRREIELDRDQTFDEGMQKVTLIWRDPGTKSVTISARELAILRGSSPASVAGARAELSFGVSADDGPASMAQRYAQLLGSFQQQMQGALDEKVVFHLRLLKRFNHDEETLVQGEVDFLVLSAVDFLHAEQRAPGISLIALANHSRDGVIFCRGGLGIETLAGLRGKSLGFPDPDLALTVWAKARLYAAGLRASDLGFSTNLVDQRNDIGPSLASSAETIDRVLRGELDAGVAHRSQFERYRHLGLVLLDHFPETPNVLASRADLPPRFIQALRAVLRSPRANRAWPDNKFVSAPEVDQGSAASTRLRALAEAMQQAQDFAGSR